VGITINCVLQPGGDQPLDCKKPPWEREWSYGWSLMRTARCCGGTDMALLDRWYAAIGTNCTTLVAAHESRVARRLLVDIGGRTPTFSMPPSPIRPLTTRWRRTPAGGRRGRIRVPTLFFADGQCLFGRCWWIPLVGGRVEAVERRHGMAELPHVYELQRPQTAARRGVIGRSMRPTSTVVIGEHQPRAGHRRRAAGGADRSGLARHTIAIGEIFQANCQGAGQFSAES